MPKTKTPPADDTAPADDDHDDDAGDGAGDGTPRRARGRIDTEQIREVVEEMVPAIVTRLLGDDDAGGDDDDSSGAGGGGGAPASNRAVEADVGRQVREELARVREHESLSSDVAELKEKIVEKQPRKLSRFTRALWGSDDE